MNNITLKRLTVTVTPEDHEKGIVGNPNKSPISYAVLRNVEPRYYVREDATGINIILGANYTNAIGFVKPHCWAIGGLLPHNYTGTLKRYIELFYNNRQREAAAMLPFDFDITIVAVKE